MKPPRPDPTREPPEANAAHLAAAPAQLVLDLPHLASFGLDDFLISKSNAPAAALIDAWPNWPHSAVAICGPGGAGKSHLAQAWRARSGASVVRGDVLSEADLAALETSAGLAIEDIDGGIADERVLFHVFNVARERGLSILVTSKAAPGDLDIALPDLRSRLRALPVAHIEPPDDALLQAVLVKLFADRQLAVEPQIISYLALHMERSLAMARSVVAKADELSLARQRKVTRGVAAEALAIAGGAGDDAPKDQGAASD